MRVNYRESFFYKRLYQTLKRQPGRDGAPHVRNTISFRPIKIQEGRGRGRPISTDPWRTERMRPGISMKRCELWSKGAPAPQRQHDRDARGPDKCLDNRRPPSSIPIISSHSTEFIKTAKCSIDTGWAGLGSEPAKLHRVNCDHICCVFNIDGFRRALTVLFTNC